MLRVDPGAEPADDLAVDLDPAVADHFLAVPAAAHARRGEHLLQPDAARHVDEGVPVVVVQVEVVRVLAGEGSRAGGGSRGVRGVAPPR